MAGKGGYQQPSNPAPVSGPGSLSQRTDGSPTQAATYIPGLPYGQGQQTYDNQVSQPMQGNPFPAMGGANIVPLDAPTMFPEEPGTSGINAGAGVGSEAMMDLPRYKSNPRDTIAKVAMFDDTGEVELILSKFI
jgi:hypothetical protein